MMRQGIILLCMTALTLGGCKEMVATQGEDSGPGACTPVTVTQGTRGHLEQYTCLEATTVYRRKVAVCSPISAYVTESYVQTGSRIEAGQVLYRLESREHRALGDEARDGLVAVKATGAGIVTETMVQAGGYATEGTALCTIAQSGSLVFEISVPYEQQGLAKRGKRLTLELPDGRHVPATVDGPLATMDIDSQSERVTARGNVSFLPEGLSVKALFPVKTSTAGGIVLPKEAVQSDESMEHFWVMCLRDDGTAMRVPVSVTATNGQETEVSSDRLSERDRVILEGGYGLEDGARVEISRQEAGDE